MPDPWLTDEELKEHEEAVKNHPLTQQAKEAKQLHEDEAEEARKQQVENQKKVEEGELVEVYANGAVVGYRDADQVDDSEVAQAFAEGVKPKEQGAGATDELGDASGGEVTGGTAKLADALESEEDQKDSKKSSSKK